MNEIIEQLVNRIKDHLIERGVISLFGKHFIKTGIFERYLGKALNDAYDKKLKNYLEGWMEGEK
ncbi:MAG: hypothetical protein ACE5J9_06975 [Methanosarcinales archaeon]